MVCPLPQRSPREGHSILSALPLWRGWGYPDYKSKENGFPTGVYGSPVPTRTGYADCITFTAGVVAHAYGLDLSPRGKHRAALMLFKEEAEHNPWCTLDHLTSIGIAEQALVKDPGWYLVQGWDGLQAGRFVEGSRGHSFLVYVDRKGSIMLDSRSGEGPQWRGCRPVADGSVPTDRSKAVTWDKCRYWWDNVRAVRLLGA